MIKLSFLLFFLALDVTSFAQTNYQIIYQSSRWDNELGKFQPIFKKRLLINDSVSYEYTLYTPDKLKPPYGKKFFGHTSYKNISSGLFLFQSQPMNNPKYLIEDTIPKFDWEIFPEQKIILNYKCKKATCTYNGTLYIAWYTEEIPLPHGPNIFGGLPGVILELISTKWQTVEIAIDIQTQHVEIVQPAVSKKVSREKFDKIKMDLRSRLPAIIIR